MLCDMFDVRRKEFDERVANMAGLADDFSKNAEKYVKLAEDAKNNAFFIRERIRRMPSPSYVDEVVKPLAEVLAKMSGAKQCSVTGPCGICCRIFVNLIYEEATDDPEIMAVRQKGIILQPDFEDDKLKLMVETGAVVNEHPRGSVGYDLNYEKIPLPDDLNEVLALFR